LAVVEDAVGSILALDGRGGNGFDSTVAASGNFSIAFGVVVIAYATIFGFTVDTLGFVRI
jgi:hypothetical protein